MGAPGEWVILPDGSVGVLADGRVAVFDEAGACVECCGGGGGGPCCPELSAGSFCSHEPGVNVPYEGALTLGIDIHMEALGHAGWATYYRVSGQTAVIRTGGGLGGRVSNLISEEGCDKGGTISSGNTIAYQYLGSGGSLVSDTGLARATTVIRTPSLTRVGTPGQTAFSQGDGHFPDTALITTVFVEDPGSARLEAPPIVLVVDLSRGPALAANSGGHVIEAAQFFLGTQVATNAGAVAVSASACELTLAPSIASSWTTVNSAGTSRGTISVTLEGELAFRFAGCVGALRGPTDDPRVVAAVEASMRRCRGCGDG